MKKKSSSKSNKKNPLKLVKPSEVQVLNLLERLEKNTEKQLSGFVQELVKLKKNQAKLQAKLAKANTSKVKRSKTGTTSKAASNASPKKPKKALKKKKPNPFKLVDNDHSPKS